MHTPIKIIFFLFFFQEVCYERFLPTAPGTFFLSVHVYVSEWRPTYNKKQCQLDKTTPGTSPEGWGGVQLI